VAHTYGSLHDLFENSARLIEQWITPDWCVHHGIMVSMCYADPDGNQMEFQIDCFPASEEAHPSRHDPHHAAAFDQINHLPVNPNFLDRF